MGVSRFFKAVPAITLCVVVSGRRAVADVGPPEPVEILVDAGRHGAPISKYIYGQFIEHLGRCIYGGIWSEMLEDRKFFYPVPAAGDMYGDKLGARVLIASPWRVVGDEANVSMISDGSFVGEHTPKVELPGGIAQDELAIEKGRKYVGRIVLAGDASAGPIMISLVWGDTLSDRDTVSIEKVGPGFETVQLEFKSKKSTDNGSLEIIGAGSGTFMIGTASLMPADNVKGMRRDVLHLLKELDSPVYRWPGGNFVSAYDWRDGVGDRDRRPPRKNPAWTGIEHNDFGIHEFMVFCEELNAEPYIAVNTGTGTPEEAVLEVEYCNGPADTAMGAIRAANGHPLPFGVKWWAIGNEMYGKWQIGYMPVEKYVRKHNRVVDAIRRVDPDVACIGVGNVGRKWTDQMFLHCADHMDFISEHFYQRNQRKTAAIHAALAPAQVKRISDAHRELRRTMDTLEGKDIRVALDEWNYWHKPYESRYGELGCRYTLQDALGIAAGLHEFFRNSDIIYMANYAQTVNVIGCVKATKTDACFATTGLPLALYRREYGLLPLEVTGVPDPLDIAAAWTFGREKLTVGIVNPTQTEYTVKLDISGAALAGQGTAWCITGPDRLAYNEPGADLQVTVIETKVRKTAESVKARPMSVTLYSLDVAPTR